MALAPVSLQHGAQGEVRADVSIEHEEGLRCPSQDLVPKMVEATPCAEGGKLLQVPDWKVKLLLGSFQELGEGLIRLVEANEKNLLHPWDLGTGFYMVLDHGNACHRKQRFGHLKRQRPEASPLLGASNENHSFEHDERYYLNMCSNQKTGSVDMSNAEPTTPAVRIPTTGAESLDSKD